MLVESLQPKGVEPPLIMNLTFYNSFRKNGFLDDEIPFFIRDLEAFFTRGNRYSRQDLNAELEKLGWGIQIIDHALFKDLSNYFYR